MNSANQEEAIRILFQNIMNAWNRGDGVLYASFFTLNSDYITFEGQHLKGREENAIFHEKLFAGFLKDSILFGQIMSIRFLSPEVALVHQTGGVQLSFQKQKSQSRLSINTNVLLKEQSEWRVAAFHNCRIQKPSFISRFFKFLFN
ncbi:MAG TPA: SgcJ/EcaC family oxidoreductase [Cyclobacteriaceae bacterium]